MTRLNPLAAGASSEAIRDMRRAKHTLYCSARQSGWRSEHDSFGIVVVPVAREIRLCSYTSDARPSGIVTDTPPLNLADFPALEAFAAKTEQPEIWL